MNHRSTLVAVVTLLAGLLLTQTASAQISRGPDGFNHIMADGIDPLLFTYVDISTTGTLVVSDDDAAGTVNFPTGATFRLYGADRTSLRVSTNGYLTTDLTDTGGDWDNNCPLPALPNIGGGDRIYPLHDDLVSDVYYQYFPPTAPPPGWVGDVSVIQWQGIYFNTTLVVDFEILIFHSLDTAILLYDTVDDFGFTSTTGSQNAGATTGLSYACNTDLTVLAGDMIGFGTLALNELRTDQPGSDNDEYFELAGIPGFSLANLTLIAIGDGALAAGSGVIEAVVNLTGNSFASDGSVRFVGAETTYTLGTPDATFGGTGLNFENTDTVTFVLVTGFTGTNAQDLDTNDDGFLDLLPWTQVVDVVSILQESQPPVASEWAYATTALVGPHNGVAPFHVQRCNDVTGGWVVADPDQLNGGDTPDTLNDCPVCGDSTVSFPEECDAGTESVACDVDCTNAICGDGTLNATSGESCDDGDLDNADDCPDDFANGGTCELASCGDGFVDGEGSMTEACDGNGLGVGGETLTCDLDCTAASCGDMTVNNTAGETCDGGMRTATCDDDCTAVTCGDGNVNVTNGEACDGNGMGMGGETATCDLDCTTVMCGDGVVNATANEDCDDGGESNNCDDDCTNVMCGDSNENVAAGEQCDDGNTQNGDGCDSDCMDEGAGGAGGGGEGGMGQGGGSGGMGQGGGSGGSGNTSTSGSGNSSNNDDEESGDSGCSCSTPGSQSSTLAAWALLFGIGLMVRRRRR